MKDSTDSELKWWSRDSSSSPNFVSNVSGDFLQINQLSGSQFLNLTKPVRNSVSGQLNNVIMNKSEWKQGWMVKTSMDLSSSVFCLVWSEVNEWTPLAARVSSTGKGLCWLVHAYNPEPGIDSCPLLITVEILYWLCLLGLLSTIRAAWALGELISWEPPPLLSS